MVGMLNTTYRFENHITEMVCISFSEGKIFAMMDYKLHVKLSSVSNTVTL